MTPQSAPDYRRNFRVLPFTLLCLALLVLNGCTSYAHHLFSDRGLITGETANTTHFRHQIYRPSARREARELHLYIEGDGVPWRGRYFIAADPTSRNSSMLQAMLRDPAEAVFIGRPCYYQVDDPKCRGKWWTSDRYGLEVVNSMLEVVERLANDERELWLIGHSGGGALAVLVGQRLKRPVKVLTIAANLDLQAWTDHHGYSPLTGSLDPIKTSNTNQAMSELHWYGRDDTNVLPAWNLSYCEQKRVICKAYEGNHGEGWLDQWPRLLNVSRDHFRAVSKPKTPNAGPR